jgi:hypothetical protein
MARHGGTILRGPENKKGWHGYCSYLARWPEGWAGPVFHSFGSKKSQKS